MVAIQKPNVDVHFTEVVEITANSIIGKNGVEKEIDTIICATGKYNIRLSWNLVLTSFWQASIHHLDLHSQSWDETTST